MLPVRAQKKPPLLFVQVPQLSRRHQGFVCCVCFVFTETLDYTLSTFLVLVCLSVSLSLCLSISPSLCLCLHPHPISVSLCLSLLPGIIPPLRPISFSIYPSISLPFSLSLFFSPFSVSPLSPFLSVCLYFFSLSFSLLPFSVYFHLFLSVRLCPLSMSLPPLPPLNFCLSLSLCSCLFLLSVTLCVSLTLSDIPFPSVSITLTPASSQG